MAVTPQYPGVYIDELPSTVHVINGVPTANAAFVDVFQRGPANHPIEVTSFGHFTATFGELNHKSRASYGIYQFFTNGGSAAWVVRITNPSDTNAECGLGLFDLEAIDPGEWGNQLEAATQPSTTAEQFDLVIREISSGVSSNTHPHVVNSETHIALSLDAAQPNYVETVLRQQSMLVSVVNGSVKPPTGNGSSEGAGAGPSRAGSILNHNNINNPAAAGYTSFTGGSAALSVTSAGQFGTEGNRNANGAPTGIYTLDTIAPQTFNLLCLPAMAGLDTNNWSLAFDAAFRYCEQRLAFLIADPPAEVLSATDAAGQANDVQAWFQGSPSVSGTTNNGAVYFPRIMIIDPDDAANAAPIETEASGTLAGLYATTDLARGVWSAPAGVSTGLSNVVRPVVAINDQLNGPLNEIGVNSIRNFPTYGTVSWGARTIDGADLIDSQWKYINVRRLALYIEQSLQDGMTWAVFEPNAEPLWALLRMSAGAFMNDLYKQGAFAGASAEYSYFVTCDATTTTPVDQEQGRVNMTVGFAPLYSAEFVVITLTQRSEQS